MLMHATAVLASAQIGAVEEVGKKAGLSLMEAGVVATVLVISVVINILCVKKLMSVQDKRVEDKENDNKRLERLTANVSETLIKVTSAVENLERSDRDQASALMGIKYSIDTVVLQAVARGTPPRGTRVGG